MPAFGEFIASPCLTWKPAGRPNTAGPFLFVGQDFPGGGDRSLLEETSGNYQGHVHRLSRSGG
jgi:hypothetical protein